MSNTFNVCRSIWNDPQFPNEPFTKREAWLWLVSEASWKERQFRIGDYVVDLKRGQLVASTRGMAKVWRWTDSKVRRFLDHMKKSGNIDAQATHEATQITICNYEKYQGERRTSDAPTDAGPTHLRRNTKKDEITEVIPDDIPPLIPPAGEDEKPKRKKPVTAKKPDEIPQQVWDDFLAVRKAKRAPLTETALNGICKEAAKANLTLSEALEICCKRGWQGFNADWIKPSDRPAQPPSKPQAKFIPVTQDSPLWDRVVDYIRTERAVYEANGDGKIWIPEAMHDFFNKNQIGCH